MAQIPTRKRLPFPLITVMLSNPDSREKGYLLNAVMDTGSPMTVVPEELADSLGLKPVGVVQVETVGGLVEHKTYSMTIRVDEATVFERQTVLGMPKHGVCLLGLDLLSQKPQLLTKSLIREFGHVLDAVRRLKQTVVLVLGEDRTEIGRLRAIQGRLAELGYEGVLAKDYADIPRQCSEEKVTMFASIAGFVICDNTVPSGEIDELKICSNNRFVTAILEEKGRSATWMQKDYPYDFLFMKTFTYATPEEIGIAVDKAVAWAQKTVPKREKYFDRLYAWRHPPQRRREGQI